MRNATRKFISLSSCLILFWGIALFGCIQVLAQFTIADRGQEIKEWSAKTSAPWIELSDHEGSLSEGAERIWVSVNYDKVPTGKDIDAQIEISNGEQRYRIGVSVFNQKLHASSDAYIEFNSVISMPASGYTQKQPERVASWRSVTELERSGSAMLLEPMKGWHVRDLSQVRQESPALEYEIVVVEGGPAEVIIEAVPAFPLVGSKQLRCPISIDEEDPQWIIFDMGKPGAQPWQDNVLESQMIGTGKLDLEPGIYRFKLWGTDPSVNVDRVQIDFGGLKPSFVGPSSTKITN